MIIYLINMALMLFWGFILLRINPTSRKKKLFCGIAATQWILLSGLRHGSVGGADILSYEITFNNFKNVSLKTQLNLCWDYLFHGAEVKDPGYGVVVKLFQYISDDYRVYMFFVAALFMVALAIWVYKNSSMPCLSFLIYSILFYSFYSLTGYRQTIATALIVLLGYECVKKRKFIPFVILAFVAFMIHKSSVVFIPFYFLAVFELKPVYVSVMSVVTVIIVAFGKRIYGPIALALGFEEEMVDYAGGAGTFTILMLMVCIIAFALYPWISKRRSDTKFLYNLIILTMLSTLLVLRNQSFMRIQQYYSLIIMIMIPEFVASIQKKYQPIFYIGGVLVMLVFFIGTSPSYRFFWQ